MSGALRIFSVTVAVAFVFLLAYRVQWASSAVPQSPVDPSPAQPAQCNASRVWQHWSNGYYTWECRMLGHDWCNTYPWWDALSQFPTRHDQYCYGWVRLDNGSVIGYWCQKPPAGCGA